MTVQTFHATCGEQIEECARLLKAAMPKAGWRISFAVWRDRRTISQNSFQHAIYRDISNYLMRRGRTDSSPEWVKAMLKNKFLGWADVEFTDLVTGEKQTRQVLRSTAALDIGASYQYTTAILDWAQGIGCDIKIPARCEYRELMEAQNL